MFPVCRLPPPQPRCGDGPHQTRQGRRGPRGQGGQGQQAGQDRRPQELPGNSVQVMMDRGLIKGHTVNGV